MTHLFAWDGVSFSVPHDWNISGYENDGDVWRFEMEDDYGKRLDVEWQRLKGKINVKKLQQRYDKAAKGLVKAARDMAVVNDVSPGWTSYVYAMPDGGKIATAYFLPEAGGLFAFFTVHFDPKTRQKPFDILKLLTGSFKHQTTGLIAWSCYDLSLQVPRDFKLVETSFLAGKKNMVFDWRSRRLHVWLISLADVILKGRKANEWSADFLNTVKGLRGAKFFADSAGAIQARRSKWHPLGHFDQIARLCFRYKAGIEYSPDLNQIFLWVYHYRRARDLQKLDGFRRI